MSDTQPRIKITDLFDERLAELIAERIISVHPTFDGARFSKAVQSRVIGKTYTKRIIVIANALHEELPSNFNKAAEILRQILGPENSNETGMFTHFYWLMPIAKYVELYGLKDFDTSFDLIEEITKRNTGEYAVRPFIERYPERATKRMYQWAMSDNFHLRRLASEGLRPKLPWAPKLSTFIEHPEPVFAILEMLKEDQVRFVQRSVANHLTDYLKVNRPAVQTLIRSWQGSKDPATNWIIKYATRKLPLG